MRRGANPPTRPSREGEKKIYLAERSYFAERRVADGDGAGVGALLSVR